MEIFSQRNHDFLKYRGRGRSYVDDNFNVSAVINSASRETLVLKTKQLIVHTEPCSLIQFKNYRERYKVLCAFYQISTIVTLAKYP